MRPTRSGLARWTTVVALCAAALPTAAPSRAIAADPPPPLWSEPAPSVDSTYGSGSFGHWGVDPFGLPVYHYALDQNTSPIAPRTEIGGSRDAWHQVGNDRIHAEVHNDGRVQFWSEERLNQWLNLSEPSARHYSGGWGYLATGGQVYSTRYDDRPQGDPAARDFGVGYFRRETPVGPADIEEFVFAPFGNDPVLLHDVTIRNTSGRPVSASWFEYWDVNPVLLPSFGNSTNGTVVRRRGMAAPAYDSSTRTLTVRQSPDVETVVYPDLTSPTAGREIPRHLTPLKDARPLAIFASALDTPVAGFETSVDAFFGNGTVSRPDAVVHDQADSSIAPASPPVVSGKTLFVFRSPVELRAGESRTLRYAYGTAPPTEVSRVVTSYLGAHDALQDSSQLWRDWVPKASFGAAEPWLARELQWNAYMLRSRTAFQDACGHHVLNQGGYYAYSLGLQAAFRDPLIHVLPLIYAEPWIARETILYSAREQRVDTGHVPWAIQSLCRPFELGNSGDVDVWLLLAATEYALATRDLAFLDTVELFADRGHASLWEHLKLAFRHQEEVVGRGVHGLYSTGTLGDWADFGTEVLQLTESTVISGQLAYVYPRLAEVADLRGDGVFAARLRDRAGNIRRTLEREWTGSWFSRGYSADRQIGVGAIYSEAQPWPILDGIPSREQAGSLVAGIRRFLTGDGLPNGPAKLGSAQTPWASDSEVSERVPDNPATASMAVGDGNAGFPGGSWYVLNGWLAWALGTLDDVVPDAAELAWDELERNSLARHAAAFPDRWDGVTSVDDACWAFYSSDPGRCGLAGMSGGFAGGVFPPYAGMISHQPSWQLYDIVKLAGIEPTETGLRIDPHIPFTPFSVRLPRVGVAREPGRMRGYVTTEADEPLELEVHLPSDVDPDGAVAWVDGQQVEVSVGADWLRLRTGAPRGQRVDWAVVWSAR
ncbi:MAG: hypothetical protein HY775_10725 [Acidobacteria bacterium]|nr:hypothetical protein [Acidobacteriota bacterium]